MINRRDFNCLSLAPLALALPAIEATHPLPAPKKERKLYSDLQSDYEVMVRVKTKYEPGQAQHLLLGQAAEWEHSTTVYSQNYLNFYYTVSDCTLEEAARKYSYYLDAARRYHGEENLQSCFLVSMARNGASQRNPYKRYPVDSRPGETVYSVVNETIGTEEFIAEVCRGYVRIFVSMTYEEGEPEGIYNQREVGCIRRTSQNHEIIENLVAATRLNLIGVV